MWWILGEKLMLTTYETKSAFTKVDTNNKSTNMRRTWHRLALTKSLTLTTIFNKCKENMTWTLDKKNWSSQRHIGKCEENTTCTFNKKFDTHNRLTKFVWIMLNACGLYLINILLWLQINHYHLSIMLLLRLPIKTPKHMFL
jgi:hypothetical protein